jgi:hypothetical protein
MQKVTTLTNLLGLIEIIESKIKITQNFLCLTSTMATQPDNNRNILLGLLSSITETTNELKKSIDLLEKNNNSYDCKCVICHRCKENGILSISNSG